jgi:TRAP-type mannitol/chloroaromatic compound transport system permease small subunit
MPMRKAACQAAFRRTPCAAAAGIHPQFLARGATLMAGPSPTLLGTIRMIDRFTDRTGTVFSWLTLFLVGAVVFEVIARYIFASPTVWAFDVTYMSYGTLFMLGAAYALHKGAHIRTDFFWEHFSTRKKGIIDSISYIVFFFPALIALLIISLGEAQYAWQIGETSDQTPWRPILWPFKAVVPLACVLLMIQGVSELIKSLYMARTGVELEHKEKIEV